MMSENEIKEGVRLSRSFLKGDYITDDYITDQMMKKPQPPLTKAAKPGNKIISLPKNFHDLEMENDFTKLLYLRASNRVYTEKGMDLLTFSFLCFAQAGVKSIRGRNYATLRTVPSGGGRHPFELYALVQRVTGLDPGLYHYLTLTHELEFLKPIDTEDPENMEKISASCCEQRFVQKSDVIFYYSVVPYRAEWRYSMGAHRIMLIDAGHITENLYLACAACGLGTCAIGAVDMELMDNWLGLDGEEEYIFYCAPVGTIDREKNDAAEKAFYSFLDED